MDSDFIRLQTPDGTRDVFCKYIDMPWPPSEMILVMPMGTIQPITQFEYDLFDEGSKKLVMYRTSYSRITDEQIKEMSNVVRGANYEYEKGSDL